MWKSQFLLCFFLILAEVGCLIPANTSLEGSLRNSHLKNLKWTFALMVFAQNKVEVLSFCLLWCFTRPEIGHRRPDLDTATKVMKPHISTSSWPDEPFTQNEFDDLGRNSVSFSQKQMHDWKPEIFMHKKTLLCDRVRCASHVQLYIPYPWEIGDPETADTFAKLPLVTQRQKTPFLKICQRNTLSFSLYLRDINFLL